MKFFDINNSGGIINRLSSDILATDDEIPFNMRILIDNSILCFGLSIGVSI